MLALTIAPTTVRVVRGADPTEFGVSPRHCSGPWSRPIHMSPHGSKHWSTPLAAGRAAADRDDAAPASTRRKPAENQAGTDMALT